MSRDFGDWIEPLAVFTEDKLSLRDLVANGEPAIANIVLSSKELNSFSAQTEPFYDIIHFRWLGE